FLYIPSPRLFLGSFIYVTFINVAILLGDSSGTLFSYVIGIGYSVAVLLIGLLIIILLYRKVGRIILLTILGSTFIAISATMLVNAFTSHDTAVQVMNENTDRANPAENGDYDYSFFTYGSGEDIQRDEFGDAVNEMTPTVDASELITNWKDKRTDFWGYDETHLPINGRT